MNNSPEMMELKKEDNLWNCNLSKMAVWNVIEYGGRTQLSLKGLPDPASLL